MNKEILKYYMVVFACFFIDTFTFVLCDTQFFYCMRIFYYVQVIYQHSYIHLLFPVLLTCIETFMYGNCYSIDLIVMAPLTMLLVSMKKNVQFSFLVYTLVSLSCFLVHFFVIDSILLGRFLYCLITLKNISIHLIIIILYIHCILRGSQGNRL
jgi:hypothetical protein